MIRVFGDHDESAPIGGVIAYREHVPPSGAGCRSKQPAAVTS